MASTARAISVVIAHGAFHQATAYESLVEQLETRGIKAVVPQLPSAGASPPSNSFEADITTVRKAIQEQLEHSDVVLMCHSYGGLPGCQALYDDVPLRDTKILGIIFLAAFVADEGQSLVASRDGPAGSWLRFEGDLVYANDAETVFFNRVADDAERGRLAEGLTAHSLSTLVSPISYAAWRDYASFYIRCAEDDCWNPGEPEHFITRLSTSPTYAGMVELDSDHCPQNSAPHDLAKCMIDAVIPALKAKGKELLGISRTEDRGDTERMQRL